jgi:ssRNA-specific RNase YbeY (16S rRNA maturation enzyme)
VRITIRNLQKKIPINEKKIKKIILEVLSKQTVVKSGEINICFVSDEEIRRLNNRYSGRYSNTDVLAFDLSSKKKIPAFAIYSYLRIQQFLIPEILKPHLSMKPIFILYMVCCIF